MKFRGRQTLATSAFVVVGVGVVLSLVQAPPERDVPSAVAGRTAGDAPSEEVTASDLRGRRVASAPFADGEGAPGVADVRAVRAARLDVTVGDLEGAPCAEAEVRVRGPGGATVSKTVDGTASFDLPPGVATVSAEAPGYCFGQSIAVELVGGARERVEIVGVRPAMLTVDVSVDERPVSGARVSAVPLAKGMAATYGSLEPGGWTPFVEGTTDPEGRFVCRVPPGGVLVAVEHRDFAFPYVDGRYAPGQAARLSVVGRAVKTFHCRTVDAADGTPIPGAVVDVVCSIAARADDVTAFPVYFRCARATTGTDGTCAVRAVEGAGVLLTSSGPLGEGRATFAWKSESVDLRLFTTRDVVFDVRDGDGTPIDEGWIEVAESPLRGVRRFPTSGKNGRHVVSVPTTMIGAVRFVDDLRSSPWRQWPKPPFEQPLRLTVAANRALTCTVVGADGLPAKGVAVVVEELRTGEATAQYGTPLSASRSGRTDETGVFATAIPPESSCVVRASDDAGRRARALVAPGAAPADVRLELVDDRTVQLWTSHAGAPARGWGVWLVTKDGATTVSDARFARANGVGVATFVGVPPGEYYVLSSGLDFDAAPPGPPGAFNPKSLVVPRSGPADLSIEF